MQTGTTFPRNPRVNTTQHKRPFAIFSAMLFVLTLFATPAMQAQTFSVIHNFTGGASDGEEPFFGVIADRNGNLYGTTAFGGEPTCSNNLPGCGVVYKITPAHTLSTMYTFTGGSDGALGDFLTFGPNGTVYGTTLQGGGGPCFAVGCGTVFNLQPPAQGCGSISCPWRETVLYRFQGQPDASAPFSVVFDSHGNMFGVSWAGGAYNWGAVFQLTPSGSGWTERVIYSFTNGQDGGYPQGRMVIDSLDNLYGIAEYGRYGDGTIFELSPIGAEWKETTLFSFGAPQTIGTYPQGGLISDLSGNLYGGTESTTLGGPGVVFKLSPSGDGWAYQELYGDLPGPTGQYAPLALDSAGNLYGTTRTSANSQGTVYELAFSGGSWPYTLLHKFSVGDGEDPTSAVSFDASGNLYGTTSLGGANGLGVVWEITP